MSDDELSEEEYTAKLICLADECPIGRKNRECPLNTVRTLPFGDRVHWVTGLSTQEKKEIYRYHVTCFSKKGGCSSCEENEDR
ncbi:MAG: hypothetical protein SD837_02615 [Candidatus Electrothrix scaldis]|jgi:hypothetical protein|nr:MAG: hypothetical protein SD837_02615 [Candidatus Electrothrix sp. GW3-3]